MKYLPRPSRSDYRKELLFREWTVICLVVGFWLAIVTIGNFSKVQEPPDLPLFSPLPKIELTLKGAVNYPGVYPCQPGICLKEVLKTAQLSKKADRKKIYLKKVFLTSQEVEIPSKQEK